VCKSPSRMGSCSCKSKKPKADEYHHVGLELIGKKEKRKNSCFSEKVRNDDKTMIDFINKETEDKVKGSICCCYGCCSKDGSCFDYVPKCFSNCCIVCEQISVLRSHDPRELSHRNSWLLGFNAARKEIEKEDRICCLMCCPNCSCCPIAAMIQGTVFSSCIAKRMRLAVLSNEKNPVQVECSGWIGCSSAKVDNYTCCQGYQDRVFIKPGATLKCCTDMCPELCLNLEVCLFPGSSMDGSMQYMMDTRDVKPDPEFEKFNAVIHQVERMKSLITHVGKSFPVAIVGTEPAARCLGLYANCLKKSEIAIVARQLERQQENVDGVYDPKMQGRHIENTVTKMSHRRVSGKSYLVKKPSRFYNEAMHATDLECRYRPSACAGCWSPIRPLSIACLL
jgi:hypothetical protein